MSKSSIAVTPEAFHTIMIGLTRALLLIDDDIPEPGAILLIGMYSEPKIRPYLQVRITNVEEFMSDGPWSFEFENLRPERVAVVSFKLGLEL